MWPKRLFLVDDDEYILTALRRLLRNEGFDIFYFGDAREALDTCRAEHPDIVVTDFYMPRMDGLDLLERIKAECEDIGRIIITGGIFDDRLQRALDDGVVQVVLPKPWKLDLMLQAFEAIRRGDVPKRIEWKGA